MGATPARLPRGRGDATVVGRGRARLPLAAPAGGCDAVVTPATRGGRTTGVTPYRGRPTVGVYPPGGQRSPSTHPRRPTVAVTPPQAAPHGSLSPPPPGAARHLSPSAPPSSGLPLLLAPPLVLHTTFTASSPKATQSHLPARPHSICWLIARGLPRRQHIEPGRARGRTRPLREMIFYARLAATWSRSSSGFSVPVERPRYRPGWDQMIAGADQSRSSPVASSIMSHPIDALSEVLTHVPCSFFRFLSSSLSGFKRRGGEADSPRRTERQLPSGLAHWGPWVGLVSRPHLA